MSDEDVPIKHWFHYRTRVADDQLAQTLNRLSQQGFTTISYEKEHDPVEFDLKVMPASEVSGYVTRRLSGGWVLMSCYIVENGDRLTGVDPTYAVEMFWGRKRHLVTAARLTGDPP